jgi:hypothetical protein
MTMTDETSLRARVRTPETDDVLRCIGRNVVNFQRVECLLKCLIANTAFSGPASQLAVRVESQADAVHKKTMGGLAGKLVDNLLRLPAEDEPPDVIHEPPDVIDEPWMGFRFSIETDAESVDRYDKELRALVDARNDLIHHFLPRWDSAVEGDTEAALAYLDAQRDETLRMFKRLRGWVRAMEIGRKQFAEFFSSSEGHRQFELAFLRGSRLIIMLGDIARQTPRADGWTPLSTAGNLIKRHAPSELDDLHKRFGHATLKGLLLAAELFDVTEEATRGGGRRILYRINEQYELHLSGDQSAPVSV